MTTISRNQAPPPLRTSARAASPFVAWLDIARVCAMLAVLGVHAVAPVVTTAHTDLGSPTWWTANLVDATLLWCVPVFIMISGALLLGPRSEGLRTFYRKRFTRIGIPLVVWSGVYLLWEMWRSEIGMREAFREMLSGSPSLHLYFLFVLAGLYLLTPFLRVLVEYAMTPTLWCFAGLMSVVGMADQAIVALDGVGEPNAATRFLPFVGYYVMGYLLRDVEMSRVRLWTAGAVFFAGAVGTAMGAALMASFEGEWGRLARYFYDYLSPTILVTSVAAYLLFQALGSRLSKRHEEGRSSGLSRLLTPLANLSFGVFLVHVLVLHTLRDVTGIPDSPLLMLATTTGLAGVSLVVSLLVTMVLRRTPWLRATV